MIQLGGTMPTKKAYDCVVIGAGPAGCTASTILAGYGHSTLILERERFPRYAIGESLMPQTYWTLHRLGLLEKLQASNFPRKESVQFVNATGKESEPYHFTNRDPGDWSVTWQVRRDCFDLMMLTNARQRGVEACEGVGVKEVLFDGGRAVGVRVEVEGRNRQVKARVVVDASGRSAFLSRRLGISKGYEQLKNAAIYTYYKGAYRDVGRNAGATIIIHTADNKGWFWYIPLAGDVTSVGLVAPPSVLFTGRGNDPLAVFEQELADCPGLSRRLTTAERADDVRVTRDFSYHADRVAGDGWVLVGDAFGFLDPVYSSGVLLALKSGEFAADAIHEALEANDVGAERLGVFGPRFVSGMHLIGQLVHAFYDREFSVSKFIAAHPEFQDHLVRLLIGDIFNDEVAEIFTAMRDWTNLPDPIPLTTESQTV